MEIPVKFAKPAINLSKVFFQFTEICPITGQITEREDGSTFSIPGGEAIWWKCASCAGWHASVIGEEVESVL